MALTFADIIQDINSRTEDERPDSEVLNDIRDGLVARLADVLLLQEKFEVDPWQPENETYPAPANVIEFRRFAQFRFPLGRWLQIRRVDVDSEDFGWYYDGANIGLRFPRVDPGTFRLWYFRTPHLPTLDDLDKSPDGGDMTAHALVQWGLYVYYARHGNEESAVLADRFLRDFETARTAIFLARKRLVGVLPYEITVKP